MVSSPRSLQRSVCKGFAVSEWEGTEYLIYSGLEGGQVVCLYSMPGPFCSRCLFLAPYIVFSTAPPLEVIFLFQGH